MITGNESLLFEPRFMDPQVEPFGLYWCKDAEDMQAVGANAVCKALLKSSLSCDDSENAGHSP